MHSTVAEYQKHPRTDTAAAWQQQNYRCFISEALPTFWKGFLKNRRSNPVTWNFCMFSYQNCCCILAHNQARPSCALLSKIYPIIPLFLKLYKPLPKISQIFYILFQFQAYSHHSPVPKILKLFLSYSP